MLAINWKVLDILSVRFAVVKCSYSAGRIFPLKILHKRTISSRAVSLAQSSQLRQFQTMKLKCAFCTVQDYKEDHASQTQIANVAEKNVVSHCTDILVMQIVTNGTRAALTAR